MNKVQELTIRNCKFEGFNNAITAVDDYKYTLCDGRIVITPWQIIITDLFLTTRMTHPNFWQRLKYLFFP